MQSTEIEKLKTSFLMLKMRRRGSGKTKMLEKIEDHTDQNGRFLFSSAISGFGVFACGFFLGFC